MTQTPKIGIDQFWEVLGGSQLLPKPELLRLREKTSAEESTLEDSEAVANWLVREQILTPLQSEVLLAGHEGPFEFGRYRLVGAKPDQNIWTARDRKTAHPVWLHFFEGESREDLDLWDEVEKRAEQFSAIDHPNLVRVYESVVTRTHRFISTAPGGKNSLAEKMPIKRRLTEKQALEIIREVAAAAAELESYGMQHGDLDLRHVFTNVKQGTTQVMLPVVGDNPESSSDVNALGRILFRLLTGRDAPPKEKLIKAGVKKFKETMSSRKISPQVSELVFDATVSDESFTAESFLGRLNELAENKPKPSTATSVPSESVFLAGLTPWETEEIIHHDVPDVDAGTNEREPSAVPTGQKKRQLPVAAMICLTLFGFATVLGIGALVANLKKLDPPRVAVKDDEPEDPVETIVKSNESKRQQLAELLANQSYVQELIPDDQETLWESPTTGFPIDVSMLPPSPRIIAAVNWSSIYESETGPLTLQALGPRAGELFQNLESRSGFSLAEIESTVISLHSNLEFEYEAFVVVTLKRPSPLETCLEKWSQPTPVDGIESMFEKATGDSWFVKQDPASNDVTTFVVGSSDLVQQVAQGEVAALTGTMRNLVSSSDSRRHVNLMMPVISLFNTEGQKLFFDQRKWLKEFRLMLPESVVGLSLSVHHDKGDYVEFRVDHTADMKARETASEILDRFESKLEQTQTAIEVRQALPYWEPVRARFAAMIRDLSQQLRWDAEFGEVIGNAWLPPGALHNLLAGTELAMTFEPIKTDVASTQGISATPQTLEELLGTQRDLMIANPPDLNVLLRNIREEISDQYLDLPFEFNIRIAGTDLQKDGITQNQRPGALEIENQSVAEILTQVMVSANPNREITGASDPKCKLVWVITEDIESPGKRYVLITTRAAAAQKGYVLPDVFRAQP